MYVAVSGAGKARVIQFRIDTRIPGTKKKKTHVVKTLGNYEKMVSEDPNIVEKLRSKAKKITLEQKASAAPVQIAVRSQEITSSDAVTPSFNFGHAIVKQLWSVMDLGTFFEHTGGKKNAKHIEQALYYLVAHRCGNPASILATSTDQQRYAGIVPLGLDVFYAVLDLLSDTKEAFVQHLSAFFEKKTTRETGQAFYDVTTYAFESTRWGELRLFGFSKDHKNQEVQVVMGLLIDNNGIPISYELFPGNTMDQNTLITSIEKLKNLYLMDKITVVADRGLNSGANLEYLCGQGYGFVISYTLKKSKEEFKELVFDDTGWVELFDTETGELSYKSKVVEQSLSTKVKLTKDEIAENRQKKGRGRKPSWRSVEIPVKIHLTWSAKRAAKDRGDRERMIGRLEKRLAKPYQLKAGIKRGCNQFLEFEIDTDTCRLDTKKIQEAAKYDGYYALITNELAVSTDEVTTIYRGLWKIEDSFRILKTDLSARPVFVWTDRHVKGHFALCYLCFTLLRYMQYLMRTEKQQSLTAEQIMKGIAQPLALAQGQFPETIVTPTQVPQSYLDMADLLNLPPLYTNMTLTKFRASTKLDLSVNLR